MSQVKANKTYIIRHKETKELFKATSGKTSWKKPAHAKSAFNLTVRYGRSAERYGLQVITEHKSWGVDTHGPRFDEQDVYEIIELEPKSVDDLHEALLLLKEVFERERSVSWSLSDKIEKFLIEHKVEIDYRD